jgi:hypothetical protein
MRVYRDFLVQLAVVGTPLQAKKVPKGHFSIEKRRIWELISANLVLACSNKHYQFLLFSTIFDHY